ncbi:tail fiber protein [Zobellia laminariae]|uniref:tail fiber protein n=1 Tax=Zobellia laminariae TaxID=248906 RepID=UPI0012D941B2|nr:hypothetical protein [Zobellia laminariae]
MKILFLNNKSLRTLFSFCVLLIFSQSSSAQNFLDSSSWDPSKPITEQGQYSNWATNGSNSMILSENPFGVEVPIWETSADGGYPGFAVQNIPIDYNTTYRFTIWVKMVNSDVHNYGFKVNAISQDGLIRGDGTTIRDAYFTTWKLPARDKWFLVVGYIKGNGSSAVFPKKGLYEEGNFNISPLNYETYKFNNTVTKVTITTITFNSSNPEDKSLFYDPRMEIVNGQEPSIEELLNSKTGPGNSGETVWNTNGTNINYSNGNVGIGVINPDAPLTVKGKIHTNEVLVDVSAPIVPDYVFLEDYDLKTLDEVENFILKNGHLPNIKSAEEFAREGMELKQMNLKLLEKIEEHTLYIIRLHKEIEMLKKSKQK